MRREKTANKFPFSPGFHYLCHMIRKANCKINIGLDVLCRREDGYHELATVMIPVYGLYDVVEVEHAAQTSFRSSGLTVDCSDADNLCMKAVRLMQARYGAGDVSVALDKRIPFGAGLGGGSSDATAVILALDELFGLELPERELIDCAAALGKRYGLFRAQYAPILYGTRRGDESRGTRSAGVMDRCGKAGLRCFHARGLRRDSTWRSCRPACGANRPARDRMADMSEKRFRTPYFCRPSGDCRSQSLAFGCRSRLCRHVGFRIGRFRAFRR